MEALLITLKKFLPCFIGAFLAAVTGPQRDRWSRVIGFVSGFSIALYFTDAILHFFQLSADTYSAPVGFALGYFGMSVAEALIKAIRDLDIAEVIKTKIGGK
jgi:hypothetical protein